MKYDSCKKHNNNKKYSHKKSHSTFNMNPHFIAPNPVTSFNTRSVRPNLDPTAYVCPFSSIIGDVTIKKNVFIAPSVSVRADEGFPIYIDEHSNLQDGVILHGLEHRTIDIGDDDVSIYIGKRVSCAHGSIIHGPCSIGDGTFIGFNAIILDAIIGKGCFISINAVVTGGVTIPNNRFVPTGAIIDTQQKANALREVTEEEEEFARDVIFVNREFPEAYSKLFGATKNSCVLKCNK
ncbi:MAG: hypothetical protein ACK5LC_02215 [Coprobacillaceae bacterium]